MIKVKHAKSLSMGSFDVTLERFGNVEQSNEKVTISVLIQSLDEMITKLGTSGSVSGAVCLVVVGLKGKQEFQSKANDVPAEVFVIEVADDTFGKSITLACFDDLVEVAEDLTIGDVIM